MELPIGDTLTIPVDTITDELSLKEYISQKITAPGREDDDPFFVVNLGRLIELHRDWVAALPTVTPFYAVKCNDDPALLKILAALGTGFDCATKKEIRNILDLGVAPDRIIYSNPSKQVSHLRFAATKKVDQVVFDCEQELHKIQREFPTAKLILRIKADDPEARWQLGSKYGCLLPDGKTLLDTTKRLGLNVIGVCFHVGSNAQSLSAYEVALKMSAELFEYGSQLGYKFSLLDIGGGYPGDKDSMEFFRRVASSINSSLDSLFSGYPGLRVIAEPGTYYAFSTCAIAVNVITKKSYSTNEGQKFMYYLNDGTFGSFQYLSYYGNKPTALKESNDKLYPALLWGPTLDSTDKLMEDVLLPELEMGDWLFFEDWGAYTSTCSTLFNGFPRTISYYYVSKENLEKLKELVPLRDRT